MGRSTKRSHAEILHIMSRSMETEIAHLLYGKSLLPPRMAWHWCGRTGRSKPLPYSFPCLCYDHTNRRIYVRYCKLWTSDQDPLKRLHNINTVEIRRFMHWYLDHHNVKKLDSFCVRMRYWRMIYEEKMHKKVDLILASDMKAVSWIHPMVHLPRTQADYYVVYRFSPQGCVEKVWGLTRKLMIDYSLKYKYLSTRKPLYIYMSFRASLLITARS